MFSLSAPGQSNYEAEFIGRIYPGFIWATPLKWVFEWKNFPARLPRSRLEKPGSREPSQSALSYEHIEILQRI